MKLKHIILIVLVTLLTVAGVGYLSNYERTKELQDYVEKNSLTLVGTFNGWDVEDSTYQMDSLGDYKYSYILDNPDSSLEFKIVNFNSWDKEFNSYIVANRDAEYLDLSAGNIRIKTPGKYEVLLDVKANTININQLEVYSMVTFTCYYSEYLNETFTVTEGTTWREFLSTTESSNFTADLEKGTYIDYCAVSKIMSIYDEEVTLDDIIVATTYGRKDTITIESQWGQSEYTVIYGMTWAELIDYTKTQDDLNLYISEGPNGECIWYQDRCLSTVYPYDRITLESYS